MNTPDYGYASHFPVLAAALAKTTGPVLELGMGWGSTPMLHAMCAPKLRILNSLETDKNWYKQFESFDCDFHSVLRVPDWKDIMAQFGMSHVLKWDVAFIDCSPGEIRKDLAMRLKGKAKFILLHDHEAGSGAE